MAGLVPANALKVGGCLPKRDHRVTALRAGPVMTKEVVIDDKGNDFFKELNRG
ncbi:MAG TPA: hypothetical protein VHC71_10380 [Hyphomicrobium sp.]|nr:hypothetical protein [Hyphomicrobium sp.]